MGTKSIELRHVLLALRHAKDGFASALLAKLPFNEIREEVAPAARRLESGDRSGDYRYSADTERTLKYAEAEADRLQRPYVGTGHLLLALLREPQTAPILERHGIRFEDVSAALEQASQVPLGFTIVDSPTLELTLSAYDPRLHSEFAGMLQQLPGSQGTAAHSAVLTNASRERVTAAVSRWTIVSNDGNLRTKYVVRDGYFPVNRATPLWPGQRLLVTPDHFSPAIDVSKPHFWISTGARPSENASSLAVALDSAVFESGRIVGPDIHDIAGYIHGRHAAAKRIAQSIKDAEADGRDVAPMLTAMASPEARTDRWWTLALMARLNPHSAKEWLKMAEPPTFFRSG